MAHSPEQLPPDREQLYLQNAEHIINEATDPVIQELGQQAIFEINHMNRVDAAAPEIGDEAEKYAREHDLHAAFMGMIENPTQVAVTEAEAILGIEDAKRHYAGAAYTQQARFYEAYKRQK